MSGQMHVDMMITHQERSAWGRPLQRVCAAKQTRCRSLVSVGDRDFKGVRAGSKEGKRGLKVVGAAAAQCRASSRARRSTEPCKNGRLYFDH